PDKFFVAQNFPNPFNPTTMIEFILPKDTRVKLDVYNIIGQHIATLVDEVKPAGYYEVPFDASGLGSGVYFYRVATSEGTSHKKMLLLR
ncbi:MAG: T9SS type A sorting domain-containing protein, partial [Bacteroidota bacterium]